MLDGQTRVAQGPGEGKDRLVFRRALTLPDGTLRLRRVVILAAVGAVLAFSGTFLVMAAPTVSSNDVVRTIWVLGAVFVLKLPLIALLWWLIMRNKEWPGQPVVWGPAEQREILGYIEEQARFAVTQPDAEQRLDYLSKEAWQVADSLHGEAKVDALTTALRVDSMAAGRRTDAELGDDRQ